MHPFCAFYFWQSRVLPPNNPRHSWQTHMGQPVEPGEKGKGRGCSYDPNVQGLGVGIKSALNSESRFYPVRQLRDFESFLLCTFQSTQKKMRWANKDLCRKKNVELAKQFLSGVLTITQTLPQNLYFFPPTAMFCLAGALLILIISSRFFSVYSTSRYGSKPCSQLLHWTQLPIFPLPPLFCFGRN